MLHCGRHLHSAQDLHCLGLSSLSAWPPVAA
jgi:hypothetical protein